MNALTVYQPWAWAIAHAGKDVENRGWSPPTGAIARPLAIHAGLHLDRGAPLHLREGGWDPPPDLIRGAVVAVAILGGAHSPYGVGYVHWHERGCWGWILVKVRALPSPVPCRGHQGIWTLPPDVEAAVRAQLAEVA